MRDDKVDTCEQLLTSTEIEAFLSDSLNKKQPIAQLEQPLNATSLFVPKSKSTADYTLHMTDWSQPDKVVLYKAMIAAYNYVYFDKSAPESAKARFAQSARHFIDWLNTHTINNRYEVLKSYEADRMDALGNHGGYSPLTTLMTVLSYAIQSAELLDEISSDDYYFITELRKTKISPNINKAQKSLASYFGALDWLRRKDIGVGKELYSVLASPKLTVSSLSLTAATIIIELNEYKSALKTLAKKIQPVFLKGLDADFSSLSKSRKVECIGNTLYHMISYYHQSADKTNKVKDALEVLLLSNARGEKSYLILLDALTSQEACDALFLNSRRGKYKVNSVFCQKNITSHDYGCLFSFSVLRSLFLDNGQGVSRVESVMFGWLMACLTVQPFDIPKLTTKSFRKMRVGGRVVQIECEYFKGRAKVFHTTRSLSTRKVEGQALLTYLDLFSEEEQLYTKCDIPISNGIRSVAGIIRLLLQCKHMSFVLRKAHKKNNIPYTFPSVFDALIQRGVHPQNVIRNPNLTSRKERINLVEKSQSPCQSNLFGLKAIKNSAVHAFSDPYTYHYLVNRNSHTNKTEKISYLTESNEEWMNSAGRITREVMFDLINNVFSLDFTKEQTKEVESFNSEFMAVSEGISYKSEEMISRLRFVTGQVQGKMNEIGVLALSDKTDEPLSPIYVLDTPLTALRMNNYLYEFQKHYKKLLATNPDLLFQTVMPTVEWMEYTLSRMSKKSQKVGRERFDEMIKNGVVMSVFHSL